MPLDTSQLANDPRTGVMAMQYIIEALRDPHRPSRCAFSLYSAFVHLPNLEKMPHQELFKHHELWRTIFTFISAERTTEQLVKLLEGFYECSGRCPISKDHPPTIIFHVLKSKEDDSPPTWQDLIWTMFEDLYAALSWPSVTSVVKGVSTRWPAEMSDLLPFGPDRLVESFLQWWSVMPHPIILKTMTSILSICQSLIHDSLVKYDFPGIIFDKTRKIADDALEVFEAFELGTNTTPGVPFTPCAMLSQQSVAFLAFLGEMGRQRQESKYYLMNRHETKALHICSMIAYLACHLQTHYPRLAKDIVQQAVIAGQWLFRVYHMYLFSPPRPDIPLYPLMIHRDNQLFPPPGSIEVEIATSLRECRLNSRCSRYGCQNVFQDVGGQYQRCSRCQGTSYCGKECQTLDWKDPVFPHKKICPIIHKTIQASGGWKSAPGLRDEDVDEPRSKHPTTRALADVVLALQSSRKLSQDELTRIHGWGERLYAEAIPDSLIWNPGYGDYEDVLRRLTNVNGLNGPKAKYMNRLSKWPNEVRKERELLATQPFWNAEIDM